MPGFRRVSRGEANNRRSAVSPALLQLKQYQVLYQEGHRRPNGPPDAFPWRNASSCTAKVGGSGESHGGPTEGEARWRSGVFLTIGADSSLVPPLKTSVFNRRHFWPDSLEHRDAMERAA